VFPHRCTRDTKMVVMGHINFEDQTLIKRRQVGKKMNATSGKLKDKKTRCNHQKLFSFIAKSCENF